MNGMEKLEEFMNFGLQVLRIILSRNESRPGYMSSKKLNIVWASSFSEGHQTPVTF